MNKRILIPLAATLLAPSILPAADDPPVQGPIQGSVLQTTNAGGYTYVLVKQGTNEIWVASKPFVAEVGKVVSVPRYWPMKDFKSAALGRTFDWILFASKVLVQGQTSPAPAALPEGHPSLPGAGGGGGAELPAGHPSIGTKQPSAGAGHPDVPQRQSTAPPPVVKKGSVKKARGGYTIKDCFAKKRKLTGKQVKVRGVVMKYSPEILGANWIHLQDGTYEKNLVVTTQESVQVGDRVVITGPITYDKNIGAGYVYPALVEGASVEVEQHQP